MAESGLVKPGVAEFRHSGRSYLDVLSAMNTVLLPRNYLEIGIEQGASLRCFSCDAVCVDPVFTLTGPMLGRRRKSFFFQMTADEFFAEQDLSGLLGRRLDIAFLDGLHHFEALLRDFINTERHCHARSLVLLHDCLPTNPRMAERMPRVDETEDPATRHSWTGDIWRLLPILQRYRPDLRIVALDCGPTGLVACSNLDPASRVLETRYETIVAEYADLSLAEFSLRTLWSIFPTLDTARLLADPDAFEAAFPVYRRRPTRQGLARQPAVPIAIATAREVGQPREVMLDPVEPPSSPCQIFSNRAEFDLDLAAAADAPARVAADAVLLCALPPDTWLYGGSFIVNCGGSLIEEQLRPDLRRDAAALGQAIGPTRNPTPRDIEVIGEPCVVLSRHGDARWGEWLGELLPRAVLAEHVHPGKFRFLLAEEVIRAADAVLESLAAYGIGAERLVPIHAERTYLVPRAHVVTSVWTDRVLHPGVADIMRTVLLRHDFSALENVATPERIAMWGKNPDRRLANADAVEARLARLGFVRVEVGRSGFLRQVAAIRGASLVFGMLDSGLTGLLYAPDHVGVVTIAPGDAGDRRFDAMVRLRQGRYADVRGPVVAADAAFSIDPDVLEAAVRALDAGAAMRHFPAGSHWE